MGSIEITYNVNGQEAKALVQFVEDVICGKFTENRPTVVAEQFRRVASPEQDFRYSQEDYNDEVILLGISS